MRKQVILGKGGLYYRHGIHITECVWCKESQYKIVEDRDIKGRLIGHLVYCANPDCKKLLYKKRAINL